MAILRHANIKWPNNVFWYTAVYVIMQSKFGSQTPQDNGNFCSFSVGKQGKQNKIDMLNFNYPFTHKIGTIPIEKKPDWQSYLFFSSHQSSLVRFLCSKKYHLHKKQIDII